MSDEKNVYEKDVREELVEGDEITPEEEGFMQGYDKAGSETEEEKEDNDEEE